MIKVHGSADHRVLREQEAGVPVLDLCSKHGSARPPSTSGRPSTEKAGLVDLTDDDRVALLGAFLSLADMLKGESRKNLIEVWRRRGRRMFEAEQ